MNAPRVFDLKHYEALNSSRGTVVSRLLAELKQPLGLRTAVDVGCGLGYFSALLQSLGLQVTAADGRRENAEEAARRVPSVHFHTINAEDAALRSLGPFDLVFCFGLLYHLENPLLAIRHLHAMTRKVLLAEGVIFPGNSPSMALVDEVSFDDQGLNHVAFYPTEACLQKMFYCAGFRFVYRFTAIPDHPDYHYERRRPKIRTILAASHGPITTPQLQMVPQPFTPIQPWDAQNVAANTSSAEALRGFRQKTLSEKLQTLGDLFRRKVSSQRRAGG